MLVGREVFAPLCHLLRDYRHPWWVAGGWVVDLHLGYETRPHSDLEIAIPRDDQQKLRDYLGEATIWQYAKDQQLYPWAGDMLALPCHELHAEVVGYGHLEVLLNDFSETHWIYRRDPRITLPRTVFLTQPPAPEPMEMALLYKSKHMRLKDEADFAALLPILTSAQRQWLADALALTMPDHVWIKQLRN